jgi:hypothetical protein
MYKDRYGDQTGSVDKYGNGVGQFDGTAVKGRHGNTAGSIEGNGQAKDQYGNSRGPVESDGTVRDPTRTLWEEYSSTWT